jgi:hypothetical protein
VTKTFSGIPEDKVPSEFTITPSFDGEDQDPLTISGATHEDGTLVYSWTLEDVPYGTEVSATEDGTDVTGYVLVEDEVVEPDDITVTESGMSLEFVNPYEFHELIIIKKLPAFVDHKGKTSSNGEETNAGASFVFHIEGYDAKEGGTKILDSYAGIDFSSSGEGSALLGKISGDVQRVEVTEVYAGNYATAPDEDVQVTAVLKEDPNDQYRKYFEVTFENTPKNVDYKTGITNQYSNSDEGPIVREETQAGGE